MSKMNKAQVAGAVCNEGIASTVGGAVDAINEAAKKLAGLSKTEDFSPLTGIVDEIAGLAGRKFDESEDSKLMVCFSEAVARLHNAVFDREGAVLFALRNEYEKWVPSDATVSEGTRQSGKGFVAAPLLRVYAAAFLCLQLRVGETMAADGIV